MTAGDDSDEDKTVATAPEPAAAPLPPTRVDTPKVEVDDEATRVNPPAAAAEDDEATKRVVKSPPVNLPPPAPPPVKRRAAKDETPNANRGPVPVRLLALILAALALMVFKLWRDQTTERPEDLKSLGRPAAEDDRGVLDRLFDW